MSKTPNDSTIVVKKVETTTDLNRRFKVQVLLEGKTEQKVMGRLLEQYVLQQENKKPSTLGKIKSQIKRNNVER